jgi:hypothetical protein
MDDAPQLVPVEHDPFADTGMAQFRASHAGLSMLPPATAAAISQMLKPVDHQPQFQ